MADQLNLANYFKGNPSVTDLVTLISKVKANLAKKDYTMLSTLPPISGTIPEEAINQFCLGQGDHLVDLVFQFCRKLNQEQSIKVIGDLLFQVDSIRAVEEFPVIEWGDDTKNNEIVNAFIKSQSEFNTSTGQLNTNIGIQNFVKFLNNCIEYLSEPALNYLLQQLSGKKREEIISILS